MGMFISYIKYNQIEDEAGSARAWARNRLTQSENLFTHKLEKKKEKKCQMLFDKQGCSLGHIMFYNPLKHQFEWKYF